jgi:pilus assembly protein TadC
MTGPAVGRLLGGVRTRRRLRRLALPARTTGPPPEAPPGAATPTSGETRPGSGGTGRRPRRLGDRIRLAAALVGTSLAVMSGGRSGAILGVVVALALDRLLRRLEPAAVRARREAEAADLPLAADLLAAVLCGGAPVDRAAAAVGEALAGPLGDRLVLVARELRLGGGPAEAWAHLAPVPGADRLIRAAVRSAEHGGAMAGALTRLAADLRADRLVAVEAAAGRRGVLLALPLGLCFLPAFILAGMVPVIVAVLGDVLQ